MKIRLTTALMALPLLAACAPQQPHMSYVAQHDAAMAQVAASYPVSSAQAFEQRAAAREAEARSRQDAENPPAKQVQISAAWMTAYRRAVAESARDPASVRFQSFYAVRDAKGQDGACGFMNGRNGFGGMTGQQAFYAGIVRVGDKAVAPAIWTVNTVGLEAIQRKCGGLV
jgi:hypothetical protein